MKDMPSILQQSHRDWTYQEMAAMDYAAWIRNILGPESTTIAYLAEMLRIEIHERPAREAIADQSHTACGR